METFITVHPITIDKPIIAIFIIITIWYGVGMLVLPQENIYINVQKAINNIPSAQKIKHTTFFICKQPLKSPSLYACQFEQLSFSHP